MNQRQEIIERLQALKLEGGSHEMLSAICRAVAPGAQFGWTQGACDGLRLRLISFLSETDEEALREAYTKGREDGMGVANAKDAQAEYLRGKNDGYDEGWDAGFASADDWCGQHDDAMAEHGWVRLPKDADGEYIHIGDELDDGLSRAFAPKKVKMLMLEDDEWALNFGGGWCSMKHHEWRHYHAPTIEDTLHELIGKALMLSEVDGENELVAEYAKRLRLASDAE